MRFQRRRIGDCISRLLPRQADLANSHSCQAPALRPLSFRAKSRNLWLLLCRARVTGVTMRDVSTQLDMTTTSMTTLITDRAAALVVFAVDEKNIRPTGEIVLPMKIVNADEAKIALDEVTIDLIERRQVLVDRGEDKLEIDQADPVFAHRVLGALEHFELISLGVGLQDVDLRNRVIDKKRVDRGDSYFFLLLHFPPACCAQLEKRAHVRLDVLLE